MGEGKRGKPGSELERLQIFAELATEYFRMVELFTPDGGQVAADSVEAERRHWVELFRAALLRKFIVPEEHVSLKLVVRALRLCNYSADSRLSRGRSGSGRDVHQRDDPGPRGADGRNRPGSTMTCSRTSSTDGSFTVTPTGSAGPDGPGTTPG